MMRSVPTAGAAALMLIGCGQEPPSETRRPSGDHAVQAAEVERRPVVKKASAETTRPAYPAVEITEVPAGRILYNGFRGRVVSMWGVTIGGEPERLKIFRSPVWAPDGERILVSYFGGKTNRFELGVTREKGGDVTDVATSAEHDSIAGAWSPDGRRIVYVQRKNHKGEIAIIDADGRNARVIAPHEKDDMKPAWSPDGKTIAFASYRDGKCGIYTVPVGGGAPVRLTDAKEAADQPAYSPDGAYLAYVATYRHPETRKWVRDLRVRHLAGGGVRTLVSAMKMIDGVDFSPKGQWLVLGCDDGKQSDLCLVDLNGNGFRKITDDPNGDTAPSWRR